MIFLELFFTFFKIGLFTFGGGYAMLPLIQEEVIAHGWLDSSALVNFIAVSESTPGPFAINISTYVGIETGGLFGAFCATLGVVTPSFVIILIVAKIYDSFRKNKIVSGCMSGLKPAVVGLIGAAMLSVGETVFFGESFSLSAFTSPAIYIALAIFAVMAVLAFKKVHPIIIIAASAVVGIGVSFIPGVTI
ncbi:MAG: chromate transporter [Clostridiales bacterium]|nr:chromate transporter [Clostridiales bacterium]